MKEPTDDADTQPDSCPWCDEGDLLEFLDADGEFETWHCRKCDREWDVPVPDDLRR